jgi:hypothetical protein
VVAFIFQRLGKEPHAAGTLPSQAIESFIWLILTATLPIAESGAQAHLLVVQARDEVQEPPRDGSRRSDACRFAGLTGLNHVHGRAVRRVDDAVLNEAGLLVAAYRAMVVR